MGAHCGLGCLFEADADFPLAAPLCHFSLAGPLPGLRTTPEPGRKDGFGGWSQDLTRPEAASKKIIQCHKTRMILSADLQRHFFLCKPQSLLVTPQQRRALEMGITWRLIDRNSNTQCLFFSKFKMDKTLAVRPLLHGLLGGFACVGHKNILRAFSYGSSATSTP